MPSAWPLRPPILCLVTDRVALAQALGREGHALEVLHRQVAAAIDAGVDLVQLRERDLEAGMLCDIAGSWVERAQGSSTRIVVNDRLDVALIAGAGGVHLRGESFNTAAARALSPGGFLVGRSVRSASVAASAGQVDYVVIGTVFATPSKPGGDSIVGIAELARAAAAATAPVLAIGGVCEDRLAEVAQAGAAGCAAIRLFFGLATDGLNEGRRRVAEWRRVFDTNRPIS